MEVTKEWEIILDSSRHSLAGFMIKWKKEKSLRKFFITESKKLLSNHIDFISKTESQKNRIK